MKVVTEIQKQITARVIQSMYQLIAVNRISSKIEFAKAVRFTYPHLLRLERQGNTSISLDAIFYLTRDFGISSTWLITGNGAMVGDFTKFYLNQKVNQNAPKSKRLENLMKS